MKKLIKWTLIVVGGLVVLTALAGAALYPSGMQKLTRSYPNVPVETVNIPTGPDSVARGRHVAIIWACTKCHGENLSGKLLADDPLLGTIPASNLTAGKGGVAMSFSDTDWIRAIRHGVKPDGRVAILMNDYSTISDQDLGDLLAYLKQIPPVDAEFPALHVGPVTPLAPAFGFYTPAAETIDHTAPRPADPAPGASVEYGQYLSVLCSECHGASLANKLKDWNQDDFTRAMHTGILPDGKKIGPAMTSKTFTELNDTELTALWLYLNRQAPSR